MGKVRDKESIDRQVSGIRASAKEKNDETIEKVHKVIDSMKRKKLKINVKTVAEQAGVVRKTIYNNDQLFERIKSLRAMSKGSSIENEKTQKIEKSKLQKDKIIALRKQIEELKKEKANLVAQLVEMEELKAENERLKNRKKT